MHNDTTKPYEEDMAHLSINEPYIVIYEIAISALLIWSHVDQNRDIFMDYKQ